MIPPNIFQYCELWEMFWHAETQWSERGLWGAVRGPRWIQILSSCNNIAHQWFVSERMREKDREREPRQSDSPSIFEALCHSSPLRLLHLIHSFHAALYDSLFTPTEHFDSLSHLIRQSVNLSLTPSLPPPIRTHPFFSHYSWIVLNAFSFTLLLFLCCTVTAIYLRHFLFKGIHSLSGQISLLLLPTFSQLIKKGQTIRKKKNWTEKLYNTVLLHPRRTTSVLRNAHHQWNHTGFIKQWPLITLVATSLIDSMWARDTERVTRIGMCVNECMCVHLKSMGLYILFVCVCV